VSLAAGIDVGGTKCLGIVIDDSGNAVCEVRKPTPSADKLVATLSSIVHELGEHTSVGLGVPGLISRDGVIRSSPNMITAVEFPVRKQLEQVLGETVWCDNDATCAALAEWQRGAGVGSRDMWMVTLGTGIGGGLVSGGALQHGAHGHAGEVGHMVVQADGHTCPCGQRGCWERYASGAGLSQLAGGVPGEVVIERARSGDIPSINVLNEFCTWVALGLANIANMSDPDTIVIGGGVMENADILLPRIQERFATMLYAPSHRTHPVLKSAQLGERAGAIGAALLHLHD
jgi:glucokinase